MGVRRVGFAAHLDELRRCAAAAVDAEMAVHAALDAAVRIGADHHILVFAQEAGLRRAATLTQRPFDQMKRLHGANRDRPVLGPLGVEEKERVRRVSAVVRLPQPALRRVVVVGVDHPR